MELHQLRYFVALADVGNFTRAAAACHVTQPSLSQQIRKLEDEWEVELFERRRNRTQSILTAEGEVMLGYAQRVLADVAAAQHVVHQLRLSQRKERSGI